MTRFLEHFGGRLMPSKKYRLRYLPIFYDELEEKVTYIAEELKNPQAANDLLDKVEKAILERLPIAESFEPFHSIREHKYTYYRIYVDNYIIYYVVIDDNPDDLIMEVRRFLHNRQKQNL
jgi:plasmid stabilization system protein ParE